MRSGGRPMGWHCWTWDARASSASSPNGLPTICRPTGSPPGSSQPGPNVTRHVGSEPVQLVHPWKHLRDEPQPAQREERPPTERQVELDFVDFDAELAEPDGGATAHPLDGRVDPDPGDIGAVGDPQ